jgi:hypothetical protein
MPGISGVASLGMVKREASFNCCLTYLTALVSALVSKGISAGAFMGSCEMVANNVLTNFTFEAEISTDASKAFSSNGGTVRQLNQSAFVLSGQTQYMSFAFATAWRNGCRSGGKYCRRWDGRIRK